MPSVSIIFELFLKKDFCYYLKAILPVKNILTVKSILYIIVKRLTVSRLSKGFLI